MAGALHVLDVVAALALAGLADLHEKFAVLREFQDHVVVEIAGRGLAFRRRSRPCRAARRRLPEAAARSGTAVAANPDVALVVDEDSVIRLRPVVAFAGTAPVADEIARLVELEHRRRRRAAFRFHDTRPPLGRRIGRGVVLHRFERGLPRWTIQMWSFESTPTPMTLPSSQWLGSGFGHIGSTSNRGAITPAAFTLRDSVEHNGADSERQEERDEHRTQTTLSIHTSQPSTFRGKLLFTSGSDYTRFEIGSQRYSASRCAVALLRPRGGSRHPERRHGPGLREARWPST